MVLLATVVDQKEVTPAVEEVILLGFLVLLVSNMGWVRQEPRVQEDKLSTQRSAQQAIMAALDMGDLLVIPVMVVLVELVEGVGTEVVEHTPLLEQADPVILSMR